ncbi:MAG TPA: hypothetical protein VKV95_07230 [Terriglobia bacterium]|nr:hypothetical protein [Terriglobia bacterium]
MRVEILSELEPGDSTLEIPWASPNRPLLRYVDLRRFPEKILSLAECRSNPPLARLLQRVNMPGSTFRTAKCDFEATTQLTDEEELDFQLPLKVGGYVDLVFERSDLHSRLDPHVRLARNLERSLAGCRLRAQMSIVVRRCLYHEDRKWGYSLTFFIYAYGATRSTAKRDWARALDKLGDALAKIAPQFPKKSAK